MTVLERKIVKGADNAFTFIYSVDGSPLNLNTAGITKVTVQLDDLLIESTDRTGGEIRWGSQAGDLEPDETGEILFDIAKNAGIQEGVFNAEIVLYDTVNTNGIVIAKKDFENELILTVL